MPSITLNDIPEDIHARLVREAEANHRSLDGEAVRRLELSFDIESAFNSRRDAAWVEAALASGPEERLSRGAFDAAVQRGLDLAAQKTRTP